MIKLICLDMDGVLTQEKNFWLKLHEKYGTLDEGMVLTKRYLHTDYARLVREVVGRLWRGQEESRFLDLTHSIPLSDGIHELFAAFDRVRLPDGSKAPRAILTSGPYELAARIDAEFGVDHIFANQLVFKDGAATGEFRWPVGAGTRAKVDLLEVLCDDLGILPQDVLYIGDSKADIEMFRIVGMSIAFNDPPAELAEIATYVVRSSDLRDVIPYIPAGG